MSQTTHACGKRSCACHSDSGRRYGPNTYLTFHYKEDKGSRLYASQKHFQEAKNANVGKNAYRYFSCAIYSPGALAVFNR
jgi:hypothetical protein